jgi:tetratricopeptide (TPR) repeat protein
VRGFLSEAQEFYDQLYALSSGAPVLLRAAFTQATARIAWALDHYDKARKFYEESEALFNEGGDERSATFCHVVMAFLDRGDGNIDGAEQRFTLGLEYARKHGADGLLALAYTGLGSVAMDRGDLAEARRLKEEGLVIYRRLGDLWIMGLIMWGLARVAISQKDLVRADQALCEWTGICLALGNKWSFPYILETFGESALAAGDLARASTLFGGAESLRNSIGIQFSNTERREHEENMAKLRELTDTELLRKSWQQGTEMAADDLMKMARRTVCAPAA